MKFHQVFREAVKAAVAYKQNTTDFLDQVMQELEVGRGERCRSGGNAVKPGIQCLNCACTTCIREPWGPLVVALCVPTPTTQPSHTGALLCNVHMHSSTWHLHRSWFMSAPVSYSVHLQTDKKSASFKEFLHDYQFTLPHTCVCVSVCVSV